MNIKFFSYFLQQIPRAVLLRQAKEMEPAEQELPRLRDSFT